MNTKSFGLGTFHGDLSTDKREKANNVSVTRRFINNACWCRINTFCHLMAGDISNVIFFGVGQANINKSQCYSPSSILEMPSCHINILSGILYTCISFRSFLLLISLNFLLIDLSQEFQFMRH